MKPFRKLDELLNNLTMYRLVLYGLGILAGVSIVFAFLDQLSLSGIGLLVSLGTLITVCYITNRLISGVWQVASNSESWLITALILFCILPPATTGLRLVVIVIAGIVAMASKYLLAFHRKNIVNPAAFAAAFVGLFGLVHATWWIGSSITAVFTLVLGALVIRKTRRFQMVMGFLLVSLLITAVLSIHHGYGLLEGLKGLVLSSPLLFLGTIMLTEPATMPPRHRQQILYGILVGGLFASQLHVGAVSITPELALLVGNIYAFSVSPKYKLRLSLKAVTKLSNQVYDFSFLPDRAITFLPGQYLEWTLGHRHMDDRGNRRTFTIASSPTEKEIHLGAKFYEPPSSFKKTLLSLKPGDTIVAGQLAGDFTLPENTQQKLVFIAGGIGVTPYRSMVKYMLDNNEKRNITMLYSEKQATDLAYGDVFNEAVHRLGFKMVYTLTDSKGIPVGWPGKTGPITTQMITSTVPDYKDRLFYISGTHNMVVAMNDILSGLGVAGHQIKTDFFPGYA